MELHNLVPAGKKRKRVGRGGSRGGTSGKGHKGQRARTSGNVRPGFEGGQMPLYRRLPKRGFTNARFQRDVISVNIGRISEVCSDGDIVTREMLIDRGIIKGGKSKKSFFIKVLGEGVCDKKLTVCAYAFSATARRMIEEAGGNVEFVEKG